MADRTFKHDEDTKALFLAILSLKNEDDCLNFFEDLCTMKEPADMTQRFKAARMLLEGHTYEQIVGEVKISTATISRINRCIQYGDGGYKSVIDRMKG